MFNTCRYGISTLHLTSKAYLCELVSPTGHLKRPFRRKALHSEFPVNAGIFDIQIYMEIQCYADTKRVHSTIPSKQQIHCPQRKKRLVCGRFVVSHDATGNLGRISNLPVGEEAGGKRFTSVIRLQRPMVIIPNFQKKIK